MGGGGGGGGEGGVKCSEITQRSRSGGVTYLRVPRRVQHRFLRNRGLGFAV